MAEPVLEPELDWERSGDVDDVVFVQGADLEGDEVYLTYGAADRCVGAAVALGAAAPRGARSRRGRSRRLTRYLRYEISSAMGFVRRSVFPGFDELSDSAARSWTISCGLATSSALTDRTRRPHGHVASAVARLESGDSDVRLSTSSDTRTLWAGTCACASGSGTGTCVVRLPRSCRLTLGRPRGPPLSADPGRLHSEPPAFGEDLRDRPLERRIVLASGRLDDATGHRARRAADVPRRHG